jgi:hypothetical protein
MPDATPNTADLFEIIRTTRSMRRGYSKRYRSRVTLRSKSRSTWVMERSLRKQNPFEETKETGIIPRLN